jgi:iron uptake system component EfeO
MQNTSELSAGAQRGMRLALAGSVLLVVAGLAAFTYASRAAKHGVSVPSVGQGVTVTIRDGVCDPAQLSVPAGRTVFTIVNQSARVVEWEILDGVMVLEERENIAPGFSQTITAKLSPGSYQITCGLLSNPHGTLTVTPSAESNLEANKPPLASFVGPLAEYRVYTVLEAGNLLDNTQALLQAVQAGDLARARTLYAAAHQAYEHIAPASQMFADLDTRINARADYFEKREADAAFTGFQRIAFALFQQNSLDGQMAVATQLLADVQTLQERLRSLQLPPERLAGAATRAAQKLASATPATNAFEDLTSQLQGVQKVVEVLRPLLAKAKPDVLAAVDADFAALNATSAATPSALTQALQALAKHIAQISPALGLE